MYTNTTRACEIQSQVNSVQLVYILLIISYYSMQALYNRVPHFKINFPSNSILSIPSLCYLNKTQQLQEYELISNRRST